MYVYPCKHSLPVVSSLAIKAAVIRDFIYNKLIITVPRLLCWN